MQLDADSDIKRAHDDGAQDEEKDQVRHSSFLLSLLFASVVPVFCTRKGAHWDHDDENQVGQDTLHACGKLSNGCRQPMPAATCVCRRAEGPIFPCLLKEPLGGMADRGMTESQDGQLVGEE